MFTWILGKSLLYRRCSKFRCVCLFVSSTHLRKLRVSSSGIPDTCLLQIGHAPVNIPDWNLARDAVHPARDRTRYRTIRHMPAAIRSTQNEHLTKTSHLLVDTQYPLNKIANIQSITKFCGSVIIGFLSLSFDVFSNVFLKENPLSHRFHWNTFFYVIPKNLYLLKWLKVKELGFFKQLFSFEDLDFFKDVNAWFINIAHLLPI